MNFFALQLEPTGRVVPVAFDERPIPGKGWARTVIKGSVREIPDAGLDQLAAWMEETAP